ncbi:MAG: 4Fe-4S binding protein [Thermoplasmata archaeon]|nr:4Fe-4S binding protein [Thermoplasmata archaeon]
MSKKTLVILSDCSSCIGLGESELDNILSLLKQDKNIGAILRMKPVCDRKARKEYKTLDVHGCDRAIIVYWCSMEQIGASITLPKKIHPSLVETLNMSLCSPKGKNERANPERLTRIIKEIAARLSLAEPVKDRQIKFSSSEISVIGSSDQAIKAAKALALHGIKTKLIVPQSLPNVKLENIEIIDGAEINGLSGIPGNFKISYFKKGERKETDAAGILLMSERCLVDVRPPANPRIKFVPLEQFEDHVKSGSRAKGIVFFDDLGSLTSTTDQSIPAWHILLESAKTAVTNKIADSVCVVARDVKASGLLELAWKEAAEAGVKFIRYEDKARPKIEKSGPFVSVKDLVLGESLLIPADIIVAPITSRPWEPSFIEKLFIPSDWNFRVRSRGPQRGLGQSTCDGIFLFGYSAFGKLTDQAYPDLGSVVSQISSFMRQGYHVAKGAVAEINEEKCSACYTCVRTCPYRAATMNASWKAEIVSEKCAGCGSCVAVCPSKAIELKNCTREQIKSQIETSLEVAI